ncbi:hypothetical protein D3C72_1989750 [compost metagenome]
MQWAGDIHPLGFLAIAQLQADSALQIPVVQALMGAQILRSLRNARAFEISRGRHHDARRGCQLPGDHRRVGHAGDADGYIKSTPHRVDLLVAEHQLQLDVRVLFMKQRNQWPQPPKTERHRRIDPQYTA